jgi:plastocyanin
MRTSLRFRSWCISSALAGIVAVASPSRGDQEARWANLSGKIEFRGFARAPSYSDDFYSYRPPSDTPRPESPLRAIVYLEDRDGRLEPAREPEPAAIDQKGEVFVPHILAVQAGTRVDFPNSDVMYHNVFSFSRIKRFDLGRYPKGQSRAVIFDRVGLVRVFCEIHSHMSAFVLVLPHPYFATTDASGSYRIGKVPPGRYYVVVWNDQFRPARREVELRRGEDTRLDVVLERPR